MTKKVLNADAMVNELKGNSVFFKKDTTAPKSPRRTPPPVSPEKSSSPNNKSRTSEVPDSRTSEVTKSGSSGVTKSRSSEDPESESHELPKLQPYELRNFDKLRRLDARVTNIQKRFLDELEDTIREQMPEGEANDPMSKRITKNSILRVFVDIFRQLDLKIDASNFKNEADLLEELYKQLITKLADIRSSEVPD